MPKLPTLQTGSGNWLVKNKVIISHLLNYVAPLIQKHNGKM